MVLTRAERQFTDDLDLSIQQFVEAWRLMCAGAPGFAGTMIDGMECIFSGGPIAFFNVAVLTSRNVAANALASYAKGARAWASSKAVPWLFVVTHEALEPGIDAAAVLDVCGMAPMMPMTGMVAHTIRPATGAAAGLQLTLAQDDSACSAILDVNGLAYGMDLDAGKDLIGTRAFWIGHFPVLGLTDGKPACCAAVMMVDGYRYVALVATDPGQQRRGYAEAAMRRALELSAEVHGECRTVLHASDAGRPIYARMGYTPISTHTIFMEKAFLDAH